MKTYFDDAALILVTFLRTTLLFGALSGVLSGADIQKSRSSDIVMLAGKYGILDKKLAGN